MKPLTGFDFFEVDENEPPPAVPEGLAALRELRRDDLFRVGGKGPTFRVVQSYGDTMKTAVKEGTAGRVLYVVQGVTSDYQVEVYPTSGGSLDRTGPSVVPVGIARKIESVKRNGPAARLPRAQASFDRHFDVLAQQFPDYGALELHHDEKAGGDNGHGSERQFGYCTVDPPFCIAFAAKIEQMPDEYIDGLMAHEFGHAIDHRYGRKALEARFGKRLPDSVERRADKIAEYVFGRPIEYGQLDVQCVECGGKPRRPKKLG